MSDDERKGLFERFPQDDADRFSYAELDRRMQTLEEAVSDLQTRVERLETSTH